MALSCGHILHFNLFVMQKQPLKTSAGSILEKMQHEYAFLSRTTTFSLQELFNHGSFRLEEYCKTFQPHPQSDQLRKVAKSFGEQYGVWLDNARHHITCALFLYPDAEPGRMLNMMKNLTIDFYLNDVMGRDVFRYLPEDQQQSAREVVARMGRFDPALMDDLRATDMEKANLAVLRDFRKTSTPEWFEKFYRLYAHHIAITHRDCNAASLGRVLSVDEYVDMRCHLSGMHHIVLWVEYSDGRFLNWTALRNMQLAETMERLHYVTAAFGALSNDLFSFEKEVICNGSDSNLLMMIALNDPSLSLFQVIYEAAGMVRGLLMEYVELLDEMRKRCHEMDTDMAATLSVHLDGIERGVQASWMWQVYTQRYKQPQSIWEETQLVAEAVPVSAA